MLQYLIERMTRGGTWSVKELAKEMNTTPTLVRMMLDDLTKRGYFGIVGSSCQGACSGCAHAKHCVQDGDKTTWTWKGKRT